MYFLLQTELHRPDTAQRLSYRARHRGYGGVELLHRSVSSSPSHASATSPLSKQTFWQSTRSRQGSVRSGPPRILLLSNSQDSLNNGHHSDDSVPNSPWYKQALSRQLSDGATSTDSQRQRHLAAIYESNGQCISIVEANNTEEQTVQIPGSAV